MKRAARTQCLIWAVIISAVLFLPWGNLAAAAGPPSCCSPGHAGPGLASGHCCCPAGMPGPCGACGHGGTAACRCSSGTVTAFISTPSVSSATWQASPYILARVTVPVKFFPPNIFHPPELSLVSL